MNPTRLYCQNACAACNGLARYFREADVIPKVHDVTTGSNAFDQVVTLGYRSLPVLVGPDGGSAVGADTTALARRLISSARPVARHVHYQGIEEEQS